MVIFSSSKSGINKIREIGDYINTNVIHRIESIGFNAYVQKVLGGEESIRIQISVKNIQNDEVGGHADNFFFNNGRYIKISGK